VHDVQNDVYARLARDAGFSSRNTVLARARVRAILLRESLADRRERKRERERHEARGNN